MTTFFCTAGRPLRCGDGVFKDLATLGSSTPPSNPCYGNGAKIKALGWQQGAESYGYGCHLLCVGVYGRSEIRGYLKTA